MKKVALVSLLTLALIVPFVAGAAEVKDLFKHHQCI